MTTQCLDLLRSLSGSHDHVHSAFDIEQSIFEDCTDPSVALKRTDELIESVWTGFSGGAFRDSVLDTLEMIRRDIETEVVIANGRPARYS